MSEDDRISLARLEEKVTQWMETTTAYRLSLCDKINKITDRLDSLPCRERGEMYRGLGITQKLMWSAIGITFGIMLAHLGWR